MSHHHDQVRVTLDPGQSTPLPRSGRLQWVTLTMSDRPDRVRFAPPATHVLAAGQARKLASELLAAAERAERMMTEP